MRYLRWFSAFLFLSALLVPFGAKGQGFLVLQNWFFQGAPDPAYFEGFGIHHAGIIYQGTLGTPAIESSTRAAADGAVGLYYNSIVQLDYEYYLVGPDRRESGDSVAHLQALRLSEIAGWFKSQQPTLNIGFFEMAPLVNPKSRSVYLSGDRSGYNDPTIRAAWQRANDSLRILVDAVDYLSPSVYAWYADTSEFCGIARAVISEARRIAKGKKVYPIISPQYMPFGNQTPGTVVDHDYMARMLKTVKDAGADGVIIWGSTLLSANRYQWDANAGWWTALKEFTASLGANSVSAPNIPILVAPAEGTTNQPPSSVLQWTRPAGAAYYHVQLSDNVALQSPLINDSTIIDTLRRVTSLATNTRYYWRVRAKGTVSWSGYSAISEFVTAAVNTTNTPLSQNLPKTFSLSQNFPNPFNPSTTIRFGLPDPSYVSLILYNTQGQVVRQLIDGNWAAGLHEVRLDGSRLATGVYYCRLLAGNFVATTKLILLK